jgi:AcrR family transcriptional regulator
LRKATKEKAILIKELGAVFRKHGFHGTSLSMLTEKTGLERASLYHHFPEGKTGMAKAVLLQALTELNTNVLQGLNEKTHPNERLAEMIDALEVFYSEGRDICFIAIFSNINSIKEINQAMTEAIELWVNLLERTLTEAGIENSKVVALNAIAGVQGSLILSSTLKKPQIFKDYLKSLKKQWSICII